MTLAPTVTLLHGAQMPRLGLGTAGLDDDAIEAAVVSALGAGYRLVDTAENYFNEVGVGRGLQASDVPREEVFVTTKFNEEWHGVELVQRAFDANCERLGVDYIDLFMVHWPNPQHGKFVEACQGLAKLLEEGRIRAIGTSNFKPAHLQQVIDAGVVPDVNQIQLSPSVTRQSHRDFHAKHGIVTESWSPLGGSANEVLSAPAVTEIAARRGKTPAQIVLRWHAELDCVTVPKSTSPERRAQNIEIFDFELTVDEIAAISALDQGDAAGADSDAFGH